MNTALTAVTTSLCRENGFTRSMLHPEAVATSSTPVDGPPTYQPRFDRSVTSRGSAPCNSTA